MHDPDIAENDVDFVSKFGPGYYTNCVPPTLFGGYAGFSREELEAEYRRIGFSDRLVERGLVIFDEVAAQMDAARKTGWRPDMSHPEWREWFDRQPTV
jgi:hypothetical protein